MSLIAKHGFESTIMFTQTCGCSVFHLLVFNKVCKKQVSQSNFMWVEFSQRAYNFNGGEKFSLYLHELLKMGSFHPPPPPPPPPPKKSKVNQTNRKK